MKTQDEIAKEFNTMFIKMYRAAPDYKAAALLTVGAMFVAYNQSPSINDLTNRFLPDFKQGLTST